MKIRSITINNVRRFTEPATVGGICDGLNVLCEPNEHGKSTLFDAVQALFFSPHGSQARDVKALRPHSGGAPEVSVEVETESGRFVISKRWLSKSAATVSQGDRLIAQADAAEAWIADLLSDGSGGPSGLIWVRQGVTGLDAGSSAERSSALEARRNLLSSVTGEVETMTGGRRMDLALSRCRAELDAFVTATGKPRTGGPWKAALDHVEVLGGRRDALAATAAELRETLDRRKRLRRELAELEAPEAVVARRERLEAALARHREAARHAEDLAAEERKVEAARAALASARGRLDALRSVLGEKAEAERQFACARTASAEARATSDAARMAAGEAHRDYEVAKATAIAAEADHKRALQRHAAAEGAERRRELAERIARATAARTAMEEAAAGAMQGPDAKAMQGLETLATELALAVAARDGAATRIMMRYAKAARTAVRMEGTPLPDGEDVAIPHGVRIEIEGAGTLEIRPGAVAQDGDSVDAAERALRAALDAADLPDMETARSAAAARLAAERRHGEAAAAYESLAPNGLAALRDALARIPDAEPSEDGPDLVTAETALSAAEAARDAALARREAATERAAATAAGLAAASAGETAAAERVARATRSLEMLEATDEAELAAAFDRAADALRSAEALQGEKSRQAPDLTAAQAGLDRARSVDEQARADIARLRPNLARLDERIAQRSGEAVEERLAECEEEHAAALADLARIKHEIAVLWRLDAALHGAKAEARERYFAPVAAELSPLLGLLWPEAELTWADARLLPDALVRDGREEPIEILSGGTQEQVALLVRLAFARLLSRDGRHAPVILDDALIFSDDDRIERMFDALHRQAGDLQIIVLTCRQRAFRALGGRALRLAPVPREGG